MNFSFKSFADGSFDYDKETETETFLPADKVSDFLAETDGGKYVKRYNFRKVKATKYSRSNTAYATRIKPLYLTARC